MNGELFFSNFVTLEKVIVNARDISHVLPFSKIYRLKLHMKREAFCFRKVLRFLFFFFNSIS